MPPSRDRPERALIPHFFRGLFDLGLLSDAGSAAFTRMILGVCTAFFSCGLLLVRVFAGKYAALMAQPTPDAYRAALVADHALLMAVPMWIAALVTVFIGHALFPDETDFRVLTPLPVTRRVIFASKLTALAGFAALFIAASHVALTPLLLLTLFGRWAEGRWYVRAAAFEASNLAASLFMVLGVTALLGVLTLAPRRRLVRGAAILKSVLILTLVLALPFVLRLPGSSRAFSSGAWWLLAMPPAWFVGLERWLVGSADAFTSHLALAGAAFFGLAVFVVAASYAALYAHCERLIRPPDDRAHGRSRRAWPRVGAARPLFQAVRSFTSLTFQRSPLHQGVLVGLAAIGLGLVANSFVAAGLDRWLGSGTAAPRPLMEAMIWAPFPLILIATAAARAAIVVPIELRANWVFRMTEDPSRRAHQLGASVFVVRHAGVTLPVALLFPVQWVVLGTDAVVVDLVAYVCGLLVAEVLLRDWARVPFTCSYVPGKGFVPQMILKGVLTFILFTSFGYNLAYMATYGIRVAYVCVGVMALVVFLMSRRRVRRWKHVPIEFEDSLPTEINPLRLFT